jgi:hypothetical protein
MASYPDRFPILDCNRHKSGTEGLLLPETIKCRTTKQSNGPAIALQAVALWTISAMLTLDVPAGSCLSYAMSCSFSRFVLLFAISAYSAPAFAKVEIHVDLNSQRITVVKNHEKPIVWKISSGREGFETPTGSFIVQRMDADHLSDEYDQAPMPYAIFFSRGLAIHGSSERGLGRPASHGCVRLSVEHARELYGWVEQYGASIEIDGSGMDLAFAQDSVEDPSPSLKRRKNRSRGRTPPDSDSFFDGFYDQIIRER